MALSLGVPSHPAILLQPPWQQHGQRLRNYGQPQTSTWRIGQPPLRQLCLYRPKGPRKGQEKGQEKVSGPFYRPFIGSLRGRPLARSVLSSPSRRATRSAQTSSPYGCPRSTLRRSTSTSASVCDRLTSPPQSSSAPATAQALRSDAR